MTPARAGCSAARAGRATRRLTRLAAASAAAGYHRTTRGGGAARSGLAALTDLVVANSAGDTFLAVALASTLFFAAPEHAARVRVATYLLTTLAPFALVAPVVGPLLDRFRRGRRLALAVTLLARAALVWALAGQRGAVTLYPLALGALVASKGFGVSRAAITPRVAPPGATLVRTNSRLQIAATVTGVLAGPLGAGISALAGYRVLLRIASPIYLAGVLLALSLPVHVDSAAGEEPARGLGSAVMAGSLGERLTGHLPHPGAPGWGGGPRGRLRLGRVPEALRAVLPLRGLVGFLTLFLAFQIRTHHDGTLALGLLAASAAAGTGLGLLTGSRLARRRPEALIAGALATAAAACVAAATFYSLPLALLLALFATMSYTAAKLSLDAVIQRDIADAVRVSAFARSETGVQLAWVLGGALGLARLSGQLGLALITVVVVAALVGHLLLRRPGRRSAAAAGLPPRQSPPPPPRHWWAAPEEPPAPR